MANQKPVGNRTKRRGKKFTRRPHLSTEAASALRVLWRHRQSLDPAVTEEQIVNDSIIAAWQELDTEYETANEATAASEERYTQMSAPIGPIWYKENRRGNWLAGIGEIVSPGYQLETIEETPADCYVARSVEAPGVDDCLWPQYIRPRTDGETAPDWGDMTGAVDPDTLMRNAK